MAEKHEYTVKRAGFFYGAYRKELDRLRLYPAQAEYEILAGNLYELGKEPWRMAEAAAEAVAEVAAASAAVSVSIPRITTGPRRSRRSRRVTETS